MQATFVNDWWLRTDGRLGAWNVSTETPTSYQIHNATKIYTALSGYGWSLSAICGIIGNMQHESTLSPAYIQETNRYRLPNSGANLSDVPNDVMQNFYMQYYGDTNRAYGIGLVQWDGIGITRQKLVGFCMNNNLIWYNGDSQMLRLLDEETRNIQWTTRTYYNSTWTWNNYITNTRTPEESARIWMGCYEIAEAGLTYRQENARYWYDYFSGTPPTPSGTWITGSAFSSLATAYDPAITGVNIPYNQKDCIGYVNMVWQDIPVVSTNGYSLPNGTNTLWRRNISPYPSETYNTASPDNQNPTPVLWYKDTISNYLSYYNDLPEGCLLFHQVSDIGPPAIPSQYAGDGIGNFVHVGIYIGNCQVMQSGGRDSSSVPGGGVHRTTYNSLTSSDFTNAWNYMAYVCYVDTSGGEPGPGPEPPEPGEVPYWLLLWYTQKRKDGVNNAIRKYKY